MATTFSNTWKNKTIDSLLGRATSGSTLGYLNGYAGAIVASPDTAVTLMCPSISNGALISSQFTAVAQGVSSIATPRLTTAAGTNTMTIGTARVFDAISVAMIDTTASLAGGGGGAIVPTLTASTGVAFQFDQFSLKLPSSLGTVYFNDALRDALVAMWTLVGANVAAGSSAAINVYSGAIPASANVSPTGTLLWTFTTAASGASWAAAVGGSAALVSSLSAAAVATGTGTYARIVKGGYVIQCTVGTTGTDIIMDAVAMTSGVTYAITNATITL